MGHDVGKHEREESQRAAAPSNRASIDEQTDWVLRDIESDLVDAAPLRLGAHSRVAGGRAAIGDITPEDIDPQEVDTTPDMPLPASSTGELAQVAECVDELPEALEMAHADDASRQRDDGDERPARDDEASVARRRRRLRGVLICALVVLAALAALIVTFVWQAPSSGVGASDTEVLDDATAGTNAVTFEPVQNDAIEPLVDVCGLTLADAIASVPSLVMDADEVAAYEDERVEALEQLCEGTLVDGEGTHIADVGFGLDEEGTVVYVYCLFDLDELAVADATFDELAGSDVVAASILQALGLDDDALAQAELTAEATDADAQGSADVKTAAFSGATGLEEPATWELVETYDSSVGRALGDNRVMRTLCVEFY